MAVTKPILPKKTIQEQCAAIESKYPKIKVENPYEKIIAKEVLNWFNHSKTITIFHINSITEEELFKIRVALHKHNIQLKQYGKSIMRQAVTDSKYEVILPLFNSKNCILFGPENCIQQILKITKKVPQLILLAGILEERLMSKTEIVKYAAMPNLTAVRAEFCSVLNYATKNLNDNLMSHQQTLVRMLDGHAKGSDENNK